MAGNREKFSLVFEAQDAASAKIKKLNNQLAKLGGPKMVKARNSIKRLERQIGSLTGGTKKTGIVFSRFTARLAAGNLIAMAAAGAMKLVSAAISQIGKAVMVAANVQELGAVLQFVGQRAGYTAGQITFYQKALRKSGIAQKETNQSMLRAIQGNIALSDAQKLARIAQDAATIGQVNSSEAFQTLINAVVKGRVVLLKSLGIQGTFQASYKRLAKTLGKAQTELTETEKKTARLNLVFRGGEIIAGAYEEAMTQASKQFRSMDRLVQDLQISVGEHLVPTFGVLVTELQTVTKTLTAAFDTKNTSGVSQLAVDIAMFTAALIASIKIVFNFGSILWNVFEILVMNPINLAGKALFEFIKALSDPFNLQGWKDAATAVAGFAEELLLTDINDIITDVNDMSNAVLNYGATVAIVQGKIKAKPVDPLIALNARVAKSFEAMKLVAEGFEEVNEEIEGAHVVSVTTMVRTMSAGAKMTQALQGHMVSSIGRGVGSMVDGLVRGRGNMGEIFKGMAQDFMSFFIKKALLMVALKFIPGLGDLLGNMFDTPVNDRMAMGQGADFMRYFISGALAEAQGGTTLAVGITSTGNLAPNLVAGSSGGRGGMVIIHANITGNLMTDTFIEDTIAPQMNRLINNGRSLLQVQDENITGGRNVRIN